MYFMNIMNFAFIFTVFLLQRKKLYAITLGYFKNMGWTLKPLTRDPEKPRGYKTWILKNLGNSWIQKKDCKIT